jgi:hypothetical protein
MLNFWAGELLQMATYGAIAYAAGRCVQFRNVKVNYTRKVSRHSTGLKTGRIHCCG